MPAAAAAWIEATREPTPAPRTVQPAARQHASKGSDARSTSPAASDTTRGPGQPAQKELTPAARPETVTADNAPRIGRTSPAADRDDNRSSPRSRSRRRRTKQLRQVYPGSREGPHKARNAPRKPAFIVSPSHVPPAAANAAEGHTRGRLTSGTVARLYRYYSGERHQETPPAAIALTGATGANSGEATQPTRTAAHQEPQKARRRPAAAFMLLTW